MYASRYAGFNYTPYNLEIMASTVASNATGPKQDQPNVGGASNTTPGAKQANLDKSIGSHSTSSINNSTKNTNKLIQTPHAILSIKNKLLSDLTRAIQLVQKAYLDKEGGNQPLTNSDYQVHELCQQFDYVFLFGLKVPEEGYWNVILEFTHRNVISDLNKLLNVTTCFGKGRTWLYHALNENLMESYLRCFIDNKKLVNRFYKKDTSLIADDQAVTVLVTLVAGLENVEFKLHNDVPYLDHSCWPTHLNIKRQVVDAILNSSSQSLSQLVDLNSSLNASVDLSQAGYGLTYRPASNSFSNSTSIPSSAGAQRKKTRRHHHQAKGKPAIRSANNISFDNSTTSSTNNLSDININDESSETSGRYTGTSTNIQSGSPNNSSCFNYDTKFNDQNADTLNAQNSIFITNKLNKQLKKLNKLKANQNSKKARSTPRDNDVDDDLDDDLDSNYEDKFENDSELIKSGNGSIEMDKLIGLSVKTTSTANTLINSDLLNSSAKSDKEDNQDQIENEIDKLRLENMMMINKAEKKPRKSKPSSPSNIPTSIASNEELTASSLKASNQFDKKLHVIESYSQIIENATLKMDACVKDMNIVYANYDDKLDLLQTDDSNLTTGNKSNEKSTDFEKNFDDTSVYDMEPKITVEDKQDKQESRKGSPVIFAASSSNSLKTVNQDETDDSSSFKTDKEFAINSTSTSIYKPNENETYLDASLDVDNIKQEIRIDNNQKLMLMIEIFQNGQNEEFVKFFHATRGHSQGEIEAVDLLITSFGIYFLTKKELPADTNEPIQKMSFSKRYNKDAFINHNQIDYIEVALGDQAIHFICINKRNNFWITTASRVLTRAMIDGIQLARSQNKTLKFAKLSVFHEATQQKFAIKKFISAEENASPQDIDVKNYSLVYWEDQASAVNHLIHKEGYLHYYYKTSNSGSLHSAEWRKAYYVLKNDVLTQFKSQSDKRPSQVIKLNGEDFSGCRKNNHSSRPHTIELILSNSNVLYLSAKNEAEASDWLQCFCKIISLGNLHTDVPSQSCLPCCSIITNSKLYFCHEDLTTGFYRLLEALKLQEINRISFDNENPYYCILHDDVDPKKNRYWFVYFVDENERNEFITNFKNAWEVVFQIPFTIERCKSSETRKRCIRSVRSVLKIYDDVDEEL